MSQGAYTPGLVDLDHPMFQPGAEERQVLWASPGTIWSYLEQSRAGTAWGFDAHFYRVHVAPVPINDWRRPRGKLWLQSNHAFVEIARAYEPHDRSQHKRAAVRALVTLAIGRSLLTQGPMAPRKITP